MRSNERKFLEHSIRRISNIPSDLNFDIIKKQFYSSLFLLSFSSDQSMER